MAGAPLDQWSLLDPALAQRRINAGVTLNALIDISSAQLKAIVSKPIPILPAPGPNKMLVVLSATYYFIFGSIPYVNPNGPILQYGATGTNAVANSASGFSGSVSMLTVTPGINDNEHTNIFLNQPIIMTDNNGDYVNGDGTAKIALSYIVADFTL